MNKLKRPIAGMCAAVLAMSAFGLSAFADETTLNSFEAVSDNVKLLGRTKYLEDKGTLWFGQTDTGVEFSFTGTTVTFKLTADGSAASDDNPARIKLYADGECVTDTNWLKETKGESKTLDLSYTFENSGEHTIALVKVSENENGTLRLDEILTDAESISPTAAKSHKIEFIGDSITCGYGVDGGGSFTTKKEDGTKTYAYKAAQMLDADYSMVSYSGFGIISGYSGNGERNETSTLPQYYDKLGFSWWSDFEKQMNTEEWDFSAFTPDLIVINLGTNDASYISSIKDDAKKQSESEAYATEYAEFLKELRAKNPDSEILCTLGIMGQDMYPYMEKAVEAYKTETGDQKVNVLEFDVQNSDADDVGADWHPSPITHTKAAKKLVDTINELYGWEVDLTPGFDKGDANLDARINIKDVLRIQKYINGEPEEGTAPDALLDLNGDGSVNIKDVIRMQKMLNNDEV